MFRPVPQPTASPLRTARFRMASIPDSISLGGNAVGTAVMEDVPEETTSFDHESEQNLEAARAYSENTNNLPYILIGGAGLVVFLLILWRIIKIAKS